MKLLKRLREKLTKRMKRRILIGLSLVVIAIVAIVIIVEMNNYGKEQLRIASILAVEDDEASKYDPYDRSQKRSAYGDLNYELGYELEQFTGGIAGACGFDWNAVIASYTDDDPEKAVLQVMQLADAYSLVNHEPFSVMTLALMQMESDFFVNKKVGDKTRYASYGIIDNMTTGKYDIYKYLGDYVVPSKMNTQHGSGAVLNGAAGAFTPVQIEADKDSEGHIYIDGTNSHLQTIYGDSNKQTLRKSAQKALELVGHPDIYSDAVTAFANNNETVQISSAKELIDQRGVQMLSVDMLVMFTNLDSEVNLIGVVNKDEDAPGLTAEFFETGEGHNKIADWDNMSIETKNLMQVMAQLITWNGGRGRCDDFLKEGDLRTFALDFCNYLVREGSGAITSSDAFTDGNGNYNEYNFMSNAIYGQNTDSQKKVKKCWDAILDCVYESDNATKQRMRNALDAYGSTCKMYSGTTDGQLHTIAYKYAFNGLLRAQVALERICKAANCGTIPSIYTIKYEQTFAARTSAGGRGASGSFVEDMLRYCENRLGVEYTQGSSSYLGNRWYCVNSITDSTRDNSVGYDCASLISAAIIEGAGIKLNGQENALQTSSWFDFVDKDYKAYLKNDGTNKLEFIFKNPTYGSGQTIQDRNSLIDISKVRVGDLALWGKGGSSSGHAAIVYSVENGNIKFIEIGRPNYKAGNSVNSYERAGVRIYSIWGSGGEYIAYIFRMTQHTIDAWGTTDAGPHPEITDLQRKKYMYIGKKAWQNNQDNGIYLDFFNTGMPSYITKP